ncbi:secretin and TonB N-terminal domain-containing protein [Orrella sp. JC864]|uniref:secretin and TonB N-terminal domain-containing protein n=1 Tax=Orrella sp. JC864 TaxID=3120298 RepID=UPI0012BBB224
MAALLSATWPLWAAQGGLERVHLAAPAAPGRADPPHTFALPSQPLHQALQQYSRQTRLSVFYETTLVAGKHSRPVQGVYTAPAALAELLADTALAARFTSQRTIVLTAEPAVARMTKKPPEPAALQQFDAVLRARIAHALCARPGLELGAHRMALRVWVDRDGRIGPLQVRVAGRPQLEAGAYAALAGLPVGRLPSGAAEPAVMVVTPETVRRHGGCP